MKIYIFFFLFLTSYKWNLIKKILSNDKCTNEIKYNTKIIIFNNYYDWTKKITHLFIKNNKKIVKNIKFNDLNMYASSGLIKAINKFDYTYNDTYNNTSNFAKYALFYIKSDLYKGVSDLTPIKLLPHHYRINNKWKKNNKNLYRKSMKIINTYGCNDRNFKYIHAIKKSNIIIELEPFLQRIYNYRYDENMNIKFSIQKISQLMCVSDETIRKSLIIINNNIKKLYTSI
jgi:DNA-directed RNA polymerase sigma subunit (sigma70/sigma32)